MNLKNNLDLAAAQARCPALLALRSGGIGHTALHWAAARDDAPQIAWLLDCGLSPDVRNTEGGTALHAAAGNGAAAAIALLARPLSCRGALDLGGKP